MEATNEQAVKEFTEAFLGNIGTRIAGLCNENNKELESAWLKGGKQKIGISVTIGNERPPEVKIKVNSTTGKISSESIIYPGQMPLPIN